MKVHEREKEKLYIKSIKTVTRHESKEGETSAKEIKFANTSLAQPKKQRKRRRRCKKKVLTRGHEKRKKT